MMPIGRLESVVPVINWRGAAAILGGACCVKPVFELTVANAGAMTTTAVACPQSLASGSVDMTTGVGFGVPSMRTNVWGATRA